MSSPASALIHGCDRHERLYIACMGLIAHCAAKATMTHSGSHLIHASATASRGSPAFAKVCVFGSKRLAGCCGTKSGLRKAGVLARSGSPIFAEFQERR